MDSKASVDEGLTYFSGEDSTIARQTVDLLGFEDFVSFSVGREELFDHFLNLGMVIFN